MKKTAILLALMTVFFALTASAYTVTLYNGESVYSTVSVEEGGSVPLPAPAAPSGTRFMGWRSADGTVIARTNLFGEGTTELYAYFDKPSKATPGENMIPNGSVEEDSLGVFVSNGVATLTEEDGNGVLYYVRGSHHASIQWPVEWEAGRKYYVSYKIKTEYDNVMTAHNYRYNYVDSKGNPQTDTAKNEHFFDANKWHTVEYDYVIPESYVVANTVDAFSVYANSTKSFDNGATEATIRPVYYDDIELIPYHKITYNANGGTLDEDARFVLNGTYTVESLIPVRKGYSFMGWGTTQSAKEAVTSVELSGSDVTLYAIWEGSSEDTPITYSFANTVPGNADGTIALYGTEETKSHTKVTLYYGDANGKLDWFTPLATLSVGDDGSAVHNVTQSRAFPVGATKIYAEYTGDGLGTVTLTYDIPAAKQMPSETPLYRFYAASDLHEGENWGNMPTNRANFARDIAENKDNIDFIIMNGDLVNHGITDELTAYEKYVKEKIYPTGIPYFPINGNHEFHTHGTSGDVQDGTHNEELYFRIVEDNEKHLKDNFGIIAERDDGEYYYSVKYEGLKLIFLSTPTSLGASGLNMGVPAEQLEWLNEELHDSVKSNETVFVISHVNPEQTTNYSALKAVLEKHPNLFLITAHSHQNLALENQENLQAGDMKTTYTHFNDGSLGYVYDYDASGTKFFAQYGVCFVVEIYEDKVLLIGKKFANDGTYDVAHKYYSIALPDSDKTVGTVTMSNTAPQIGDTVKVLVDGKTPANDAVCTWYVGDKLLHTGAEYTVTATDGMAGKRLIVRVTFADGTFASDVSETAFGGVDIYYDLNGGTGTTPPVQKVIDGSVFTPYVDTYTPKKAGVFFAGWSTDKNATVPMMSAVAKDGLTLYAVYTDKPEFHFYNYAGFIPNGHIAKSEIKDGKLCFTNTESGNDPQFSINGIAIDADKYVYVRVKTTAANPTECIYFATSEKGLSEQTRINFGAGTKTIVGDFAIYECYIPSQSSAKTYWKGTVNALRFDPFAKTNTSAETDYIVFADNKAVYGAKILIDENGKVSLSSDTANCSVSSAEWKGKGVVVTLSPASGYEFTTVEDVMSLVTVNGEKPAKAEIINDCAVITYGQLEEVSMGEISLLDASYNKLDAIPDTAFYAQVPVTNNAFEGSFTVVIASYDADGRMLDTDFLYADPDEGKTVTFGAQVSNKDGKVAEVRAFAFSNLLDMSVLCESVKIEK